MDASFQRTPRIGASEKLALLSLAGLLSGGCAALENVKGGLPTVPKVPPSASSSSAPAPKAEATSNTSGAPIAAPAPKSAIAVDTLGPCPDRTGLDRTIDRFARLATEDLALDKPLCPGQLHGGVPAALVPIVQKSADPDIAGRRLKILKDLSAEFDALWVKYEERRAVVRKALAEAAELRKKGEAAKADQVLRAVVSTPRLSNEGYVSRAKFLYPIDAEYDAVQALAASAQERGDIAGVLEMFVHLAARRDLMDDQENQRLLYLALGDTDLIEHRLEPHARKAMALLIKWMGEEKEKYAEARRAAATRTTYRELLRGRKLAAGSAYGKIAAKKGDWVVLELRAEDRKGEGGISDGRIDFAFEGVFHDPYDCKTTNKVDWISPTGEVHWRITCKYKEYRKQGHITATLASPFPEWAKSGASEYWVVGKVVSPGPKWVLDKVRVVDLRYLPGHFDLTRG